MGKLLKVVDPTPLANRTDMELLVSHDQSRKSSGSRVAARVKLFAVLLAMGLIGSLGCIWVMLDAHTSKESMETLGLHKVANSLDNILALLAYPVLMFSLILSAYAAQQLFLAYRSANDPETYRMRRERIAAERLSD